MEEVEYQLEELEVAQILKEEEEFRLQEVEVYFSLVAMVCLIQEEVVCLPQEGEEYWMVEPARSEFAEEELLFLMEQRMFKLNFIECVFLLFLLLNLSIIPLYLIIYF